LFRHLERIVNLDAEVSHRTFKRSMSQILLDESEVGAGIGLVSGRRVAQPVSRGTS